MDNRDRGDAINIAKPMLGPEEKSAVLEVMSSGKLAQGEKVDQFEKAFAAYIGTKHAVAVGNGTIAIHLALHAHGIGKGMEVVTTPFTFIGSVTPILFCQARPVFAVPCVPMSNSGSPVNRLARSRFSSSAFQP